MMTRDEVRRWQRDQAADARRHIRGGYIPLLWIHADDIITAFSEEGRGAPSDRQAELFLAENFEAICEAATSDMEPFWSAISASIAAE